MLDMFVEVPVIMHVGNILELSFHLTLSSLQVVLNICQFGYSSFLIRTGRVLYFRTSKMAANRQLLKNASVTFT